MSTEEQSGLQPVFVDLNPDDPDEAVTEIESLCMDCHENGITRIMMVRIPFFKEVIVSSFSCEACGHKDTIIQSGGRIQDQGVVYDVTIANPKDLDRQVVKSDAAVFKIPHLDFEQPSIKRGEITTVEGMIKNVIRDLELYQPQRKALDPEAGAQVDEFIGKMKGLLDLNTPFKIVIDDPSGNSFIQNPFAPKKDAAMTVSHYNRTRQHNIELGLEAEEGNISDKEDEEEKTEEDDKPIDLKDEVMSFPSNCPQCNTPCETNMKLTAIPFFKEIVLMATSCDACGYRDSEVKGGQGIEEKGTKISLHLTDSVDLSRDILKSDTCGFSIPELEIELLSGTLGGRFTTVEGLLKQVVTELEEKNPFMVGDSAQEAYKNKVTSICDEVRKICDGKRLGVHIVLDDPAGNSYLQNIYAPDDDPEMTITRYERNYQQNEELGLNDMNTENYSENH